MDIDDVILQGGLGVGVVKRFVALVAGELGELRTGRCRPRGSARSLRNRNRRRRLPRGD